MSPAAGPSSTTNGSRNPSANLERLNAAVSAIEEFQVQVQDIKEKADKKMAVLHMENEILKSNVEELSECVSFLVTMLGVRNKEDGPGLDGENGGSLSEIDPTLRGTSEPVSKASSSARKLSAMELSFAASKSKAIRVHTKNFLISIHSNFGIKKDVIIDTLKIHLGTDSLAGASLPAFPFGIGEERWPKNPVDQKPYMRLNWDAAYNKWLNAEALDRIFDSLRATGAKRCPAADEDLENICDNDLKERITDKFVSMAREFKSKRKAQADLQARIQELEDRRAAAEENLDEEFADESTAKLKVRVQKRAKSGFADLKYDAAFIVNAMSDDEEMQTRDREAKKYISRAPDWRSDELTKLYSEIDAIPDPNPDAAAKSRQRLRGDIIPNAVPPKAKVVSTRVRRWMVKPELLDANEDWMISGRVGPNGKAWGDDEDPIDDAKGKKRKVEANVLSEEKVFKKSRNVKGKQVVLKEKLDNVLGGCDADELFDE
ncbi:hypothetical protein DFH29DRAFT_1034493 [Suillus ampliporus]|nr:hypothetical protein DFH29DRAFT_1034493 [Suillus ampliporus]